MIHYILLLIVVSVEIGFALLSLQKKSNLKREKSIGRIALLVLFLLLAASPIIDWGFQWYLFTLFLFIQGIISIFTLLKKKEDGLFKKRKILISFFARGLLIILLLFPTFLFPPYDEIMPTGDYTVQTKSFTLVDKSREEYFTEERDNRKVTIQYWYPNKDEHSTQDNKFPLLLFSHGAFGYRMSNYSTYMELASHGYIVCSVDHPYHAFMTKEEDGEVIIANMDFMNSAMAAQNGVTSPEETYELQKEWMKLRTEDMAFVLDHIRKKANSTDSEEVYKMMDLDQIGVFGHSLGGATVAQIGRVDKDIDAIIVVDGTMLGEIIAFENEKNQLNNTPYPKPILNIYNESHYKDALAEEDEYPNRLVHKNAAISYEMVFKGSGHMSFTDLSIISPFLSNLLETSKVDQSKDPRYLLEETNKVILEFFDLYLKSSGADIPKERIQ